MAPLAKSGGVALIVPASWNNMFAKMEAHTHGRILDVEFKNQYNTAHILIIVTYPPPIGGENSPHDSLRKIICNSIKRIDRDFRNRMQELGKQGIIIVLTDANLVANPTLDRPDVVLKLHTNNNKDNLALTLQQDLNYRDTYREC